MSRQKKILIGITGSVAAYKACDVVSELKKSKFDVRCVLTANALHFVGAPLMEALTSNKVHTGLFAGLPEKQDPYHIALADSDLILVVPATANIIGKVAGGIADDLLSCIIMATKSPVIFCPAMNENMYKNKIVQENISRLKNLKYHFIGPVKGRLACGKTGVGHIASTKDIVGAVQKTLK